MKNPIPRSRLLLLFFLFLLRPWAASGSAALDPADILRKVDEVRNPAGSYEMRVRIGDSFFVAWISGGDRTLVRTLEPARDRGRDLLMIGEEMWAYIPNLKRSVRVSLGQKLTGQAANGDISRMRWADDYAATIEGQDEREWVLSLKALKKGLTYDRLRVWVLRDGFRPSRAEYMTVSGKVLKHATFGAYKVMAGRVRPTEMEIVSAVSASDRSRLVVESMQQKSFAESAFNPQGLGR
jgi:outer membrane lipoprotein-sorting protein